MKKMTAFAVVAIAFLAGSCTFISGERIKGDGNWISETIDVRSFDGIATGGSFDVEVTQGSAHSLKIETDRNLLEYIDVEVNDGVLSVRQKKGYNLRPSRDIKIYVTAPEFSEISVSGAGNITTNGAIRNARPMNVRVSGAGDMRMDVSAPEVRTRISGSGNIVMKGNADRFSATISGSGDARCADMEARDVEVDISGACNAEVYATESLDVSVSGAGSVRYRGNPSVSQKISGAGSVKKI